MSSPDETEQAILAAIKRLAEQASQVETEPATYLDQYASAALKLAEARAWLRSPGQPH